MVTLNILKAYKIMDANQEKMLREVHEAVIGNDNTERNTTRITSITSNATNWYRTNGTFMYLMQH